jgi:hypothetical protein
MSQGELDDLDTYNCQYRRNILADYVIHLHEARRGRIVDIPETTEKIVLYEADSSAREVSSKNTFPNL